LNSGESLTINLTLKRNSVNFLTALMPTMEGLYLATVLDGKQGMVRLSFSKHVRGTVIDMIQSLARQFPNEPGWRVDQAGITFRSEHESKGLT